MRLVLLPVACVEAIEIPDIETAQHALLGRRKRQMVLVRSCEHGSVERSLHVDVTGSECGHKRMPHGIFVEVEADLHGVFCWRAWCASRCCASASAATMSASISSRLAW